ncbi:hypothetical protein [Allomesorhizobium alhagi]|uniref:Uncharacterized protein n=1 Tax=Mesorhizobium alhagi CCNWXJ12-2 TaxID=1107882 RepID=H0HNK9_9HYPH|nr:hypothetical protein [Mesorhizobium alhagi]EHK57662.1 hypothetical protein MAXJ12_08659 [Mesorhizobium alhagi CCNWXJ12-2]
MWSQWHLDCPPAGTTGDIALDKRLADAFRALIARPDLPSRLTWLEGEVFLTDHFPNPNAPADRYRATLIRWWLDLHGEAI